MISSVSRASRNRSRLLRRLIARKARACFNARKSRQHRSLSIIRAAGVGECCVELILERMLAGHQLRVGPRLGGIIMSRYGRPTTLRRARSLAGQHAVPQPTSDISPALVSSRSRAAGRARHELPTGHNRPAFTGGEGRSSRSAPCSSVLTQSHTSLVHSPRLAGS